MKIIFLESLIEKIKDNFKFWGVSNSMGFNSIRVKLILAFLLMIIPVSFLGIVSYNKAASAVNSITTATTVQAIEKAGDYINLIFKTRENLSTEISTKDIVQQYLNLSKEDMDKPENVMLRAAVENYINKVTRTDDQISNILILAKSGTSIGTELYKGSVVDSKNVDFEKIMNMSLYKNAKDAGGKIVWLGEHKEMDDFFKIKKNYATSAVRIIKDFGSNEELGVMLIDMKIASFEEILKTINLGEQSEVHLISSELLDMSFLRVKDSSVAGKAGDIAGQEFFKDITQLKSQSGSIKTSYNNNSYLGSYKKIGQSNYIIVGMIPESVITKPASEIGLWTLFLVIMVAVIAVIMGIVLASQIGRKIDYIVKIANVAATGDLTNARVSSFKDEFGLLSSSITEMIKNTSNVVGSVFHASKKVEESTKTVAAVAEQLACSANDVSEAIQEIATGTAEQSMDADNCVKHMNLLSNDVNEVLNNSKLIEQASAEVMKLTEKGLFSVGTLGRKSEDTVKMSRKISDEINMLGEHSKSIVKIVKVINGIVDQTKLLSLNASIEAARAGEMGKGFAVVADEVGKLSEMSKTATQNISGVIKSVQDETILAVNAVRNMEETIKSQGESVQDTIKAFKTIANRMEFLNSLVFQINSRISTMDENKRNTEEAIHKISSVTQQTAAASQQVNAETEQQLSGIEELKRYSTDLNLVSQELIEVINSFKI